MGARPAKPQARRGSRKLRNRVPNESRESVSRFIPLATGHSNQLQQRLTKSAPIMAKHGHTGTPGLDILTKRARPAYTLDLNLVRRFCPRQINLCPFPPRGCGNSRNAKSGIAINKSIGAPRRDRKGARMALYSQSAKSRNTCDAVAVRWLKTVTLRNAIVVL